MKRFVQVFSSKDRLNIEYINLSTAFETATDSEKKELTRLVKQMHAGLYCQTFTIEQEREDVSVWLKMLEKGPLSGQHIYVAFGCNLSTPKPDILGFTIADIGGNTNCGLIEYIVRKQGFSSVLKGKDMLSYVEGELNNLNMVLNDCRLKGIFWEANDPSKLGYDENAPDKNIDCMSPQKRIDLIKKSYGAKELGFDYIQGPLQECDSPREVAEKICSNLKLFLFNADSYPDLTAQDIKNYICRFNKVVNGANHPRDLKNPEINKMMDELDVMIKYDIPVLLENQTPKQRTLISQACSHSEFQKNTGRDL